MTDASTISDGVVVTIHYELALSDGKVVDSSKGHDPLAYLHGAGNLVPGLESALAGKATGEALKVAVKPEEGYGERSEDAIQVLPRENFPDDAEPEEGMHFQATDPDGMPIMGTIVKLKDGMVTVDFNHPLAGETLNFDVQIVEIRKATKEETQHGHVHGEGGHED